MIRVCLDSSAGTMRAFAVIVDVDDFCTHLLLDSRCSLFSLLNPPLHCLVLLDTPLLCFFLGSSSLFHLKATQTFECADCPIGSYPPPYV